MKLTTNSSWMRKALSLVVLFTVLALVNIGCATSGKTPGEEWNMTIGGTNDDAAISVHQTSDGGYILAGWTWSYGDGKSDIWIVKTDSNGNEQWNKTFGGNMNDDAKSVQQTSEGDYIIAGHTSSYGDGGFDIWLVKTDSNGNEQWNKTFGGTGSDHAFSFQPTSEGGYILAGDTSSYGDGGSDFWLVKTDSNGNEQWNKTFGGNMNDEAKSVQQTSDGGYILTGRTWSYGDGKSDFWVVKTDSNGNELWNKTFGEDMNDEARSIQQTSEGGYIIAGDTSLYSAGRSDLWLVKTDSKGNEQWNKTLGGTDSDHTYSVQETFEDSYIIVGHTSSYGNGGSDFWLVKTDSNGNEQWNKTFGGTRDDYAFSFQQSSDGGYILAGRTTSFGRAGSTDSDIWLIKVEREPIESDSKITTPEVPTEEDKGMPGFEAILAIAGLLAVTYIFNRKN